MHHHHSYSSMRGNVHECNHVFEKTQLLNSNIFCSSWKAVSRIKERNVPGFGLYADQIWRPVSRNEFINWPDFSDPAFPKLASQQIISAYNLGSKLNVEIGCIGGHGRTGTMLACMAVLDQGFNPIDAISFARETYCHHAVEAELQEKYVEFFWRYTNEL